MKDDDWDDVIQRHLAGTISAEEAEILEEALKADAALRSLYLDYANLDDGTRTAVDEQMAGYEDPVNFFVEKLAEGVSTIAAAFSPEPVIVRMSDFKSNEYANLIGGDRYEPDEENPMLGFRGAARYVADSF